MIYTRVLFSLVRGTIKLTRASSAIKITRKLLQPVFIFPKIKSLTKVVLLASSFIIMSEATAKPSGGVNIPEIIAKVDDLYTNNKMREAYDVLLPYKDNEDSEIQWRFARICYNVGKHYEPNKTKAKELATIAMEHIDRSIKLNGSCFHAYKWKGIILSWYSDFLGYKVKIEKSYEIRDNFDKAVELNPSDPTSRHLIGRWCFDVSDVPWYMRTAAKYILAELPSTSYEEALKHFLEAEKIEAGFFSTNWLFIGKCYLKLNKKAEAKPWLQKTADYVSEDPDEKEAKTEAAQLLRTI